MTAARVEWLRVRGRREVWTRLGLVVHDGMIPLFGTGIRVDDGDGEVGLAGWALSGVTSVDATVDGLPTEHVAPVAPTYVDHPLGASAIDHVVVTTDSLDRTCGAIAAATGAPLKRVRELDRMRQGFHRIGGLVVEVVERAGLPTGPASFWGLVLVVEDIDAAVARLGPELVGAPRPAVQPGRVIATVRPAAELGVAVALMTPPAR